MATIINQEPSTREGLAFAYIKFCNLGIMNPSALGGGSGPGEDWKPGSEGRLLTEQETQTYNKAVAKLSQFFESSDLVWGTNPTGGGIYVISHLDQPRIECVLVNGTMLLRLYDMEQTASPVSEISALWLGPLPLTPVMRRVF